MKDFIKVLAFYAAVLFASYCSAQSILIADNNPGAVAVPGAVFTGDSALHEAIAAANPDDIIQVVRSSINYGTVDIDKRLNIFGIGLNPDTQGGVLSYITQINIVDPNASGTRISGVYNNTLLNIGGAAGIYNNILIENSWIRRLQHVDNTADITNLIVRNCIMGWSLGGSTDETIDLIYQNVSNIVIANNVIYGSAARDCCTAFEGSISTDQSTIENNIFVHAASGSVIWFAFEEVRNSTIKNNIFFGISPQGKIALSNNSFENNISWETNSDIFSTGSGNTSVNNHESVNPVFTSVPKADSPGSISTFDPGVGGTEALTGATDGGQIGVYGGPIPFSLEGTLIPTIQVLDVPSMVIEGNTLDVRVKAKGN